MKRGTWHALFFAVMALYAIPAYLIGSAPWGMSARVIASMAAAVPATLALVWLNRRRAVVTLPPGDAPQIGRFGASVLLVLAVLALPGPFYVPTGRPWTLPVQVLATLLISLPAAALIVWLNGRITPPR